MCQAIRQCIFFYSSPIEIFSNAQDSSSSFPIAKLAEKVFKILFYLHLFLIAVLVIYLTIYGLVYASHSYHLYPKQWYWYPPLLIATLCAGIFGFTWQWITVRYTTKAIGAAFCLSPLLTSAMGVRFVHIGSSPSLALGIVSLVSALIQAIYGFWVSPRFDYANRILSASISDPPTKSMRLAFYSTLIGILYCCFLVCGIGGARAIEKNIVATSLFILVILLSLGWTMQFLKNVLQVTISRVKYMHLSGGVIMDTSVALHDTMNYQTGSVSFGSILVPFISLFRGSARLTSLLGGDADVLVFAYARCYMQLASALVACGNRWGFVHVGVYNKGFVQASSDTWDIFNRVGLKQLLDLDLTGSFCFLSGVAGGAMCSLVSGIWSIVVHQSYATEISIYAFLIGYFMFRLAMSWPQACVSAYYVAYAEHPQSTQFDSTIPVRLQQLRRSLA